MKNIKKKMIVMTAAICSMAITACGGGSTNGSSKKKGSSFIPSSQAASNLPKFEAKFVNADGSELSKETVEFGSKLTKPATDPTAPSGQKFYGWMNVKNGGQIWDFEADDINVVMQDVELKPLFVPDLTPQVFEAELCRDITEFAPDIDEETGEQKKDDNGNLKWKVMEGATYSGGAKGSQLVNKRDKEHALKSSGDYILEEDEFHVRYATAQDDPADVFGSFVHFMYKEGDTLTWKLQSDKAAENVNLFMRLSGEYGLTNTETNEVSFTFDDEMFQVMVNDAAVKYGQITIHNIEPMFWNTFQDYFLSATVNLKAGENIIQMKVNNSVKLNGTVASTAPCVDCIKLLSTSTLSWPNPKLANLEF